MKINNLLQSFKIQTTKAEKQIDSPSMDKGETVQFRGKHADTIKEMFHKHNVTPDEKSIELINEFMESAEGTDTSKLETVEMALMKGIPMTMDNLESIHAALNFGPEQMDQLLGVQEGAPSLTQIPRSKLLEIIRHLELPDNVKNYIISELSQNTDVKTVLIEATKMLGEIIGVDLSQVQTENLTVEVLFKVLMDGVRALQINTNSHNDVEVKVAVETSLEDETHEVESEEERPLSGQVHEMQDAGYSHENGEVESIEQLIINAVNTLVETLDQDIFKVKQYLVEKTTEATIEAKNTFDSFKKETQLLLDLPEKESPTELLEKVSKAIDKMEKVIMRSTVTLFTDMHMEKELLVSSAKLQEARNVLVHGQLTEAMAIVSEVKKTIDQMQFTPSVKSIQAFATASRKEIDLILSSGDDIKSPKIMSHVGEALQVFKDTNGARHARDVVDILRFMGINHEVEVADKIDRKDTAKTMEWSQTNVKEILLKLMKEETEQRNVQKSMMSLTGQQMMNQSEDERKRQFHYFNMPFEDGETVGNMKVYVNGRKEGVRLDAENSELYFGMSSRNLGELGIKVSIQMGKLSLKIMTDQKEKVQSVFETLFEGVEEIGYHKGTLEWAGLNTTDAESSIEFSKSPETNKIPYEPEKGFDFKI